MIFTSTDFVPLLEKAGYGRGDIDTSYRFTYPTSDALRNRDTLLVAFSGTPHSIHTACIGVAEPHGGESIKDVLLQLRYLTAPYAFVAHGGQVGLYEVSKDPSASPIAIARDRINVLEAFESRLSLFRRDTIQLAKQDSTQLSLGSGIAGWAEQATERTLTSLLEQLLTTAIGALGNNYRALPEAMDAALRLVCHLFASRVLEDKQVLPASSSALESLTNAHARFSRNIDPSVLDSRYVSPSVVSTIREQLSNRFAFASLTTEMLGHAYENALVTPLLRRQRGIFYTPRRLTKHILSMLPLEALPLNDRVLLDPCCGSGSFLVEGLERLRGLLPSDWTSERRHDYLRERLFGRDTDELACEIAALSVLLADLGGRNGWDIRKASVDYLDARRLGRTPTIIATNPPFGETKDGIRRERAAEILSKCISLLASGGFLGIVLPLSFLESKASASARRRVLRECELLELDTLPGGLFYSGADTAVLLLRKLSDPTIPRSTMVTVRELRARDLHHFHPPRGFSLTYSVDSSDWSKTDEQTFLISPLADIWKSLRGCTTLGAVAKIRNGLQVKTADTTSVSERRRAGDVPYIDRLDVLRPFALLVGEGARPTKWLRYGPHLHRARDVSMFAGRKVLVNATRNPGSAWRLIAAVAPAGLYFSDRFHGLMPKDHIAPEHLAAVLNSPIANAWFDGHCRSRKVVLSILSNMPWPTSGLPAQVTPLVRQIEQAVRTKWARESNTLFDDRVVDTPNVSELRSAVDNLVFEAYGLSPRDIAHIAKLMSLDRRPS